MNKINAIKLRILVLVMLLFAGNAISSFAQTDGDKLSGNQVLLRFDGLYQTAEKTVQGNNRIVYRQYLRFCENGIVASASSTRAADEISKLMKCEKGDRDGYQFGEYKITDNQISFTTASKEGKVDFEGTILAGSVKLNVFSHINKYSEKDREYKFIAVKFDD